MQSHERTKSTKNYVNTVKIEKCWVYLLHGMEHGTVWIKRGNLNNNVIRCGAWCIIGMLCISFFWSMTHKIKPQQNNELAKCAENLATAKKYKTHTEDRKYKIEVRCQVLNHLCYLFFNMYVNHYVNEYHIGWSAHKFMKNKEYRGN